jgi:hypothetical protein
VIGRPLTKATQIRLLLLLAILGLGIASRAFTTGIVILDKYLGDGLYAAMFFILCTIALKGRERLSVVIAGLIVGSMEVFQISNIPLELSTSEHAFVRLLAKLIGTRFGYLDILAYLIGIILCYLIYSYLVFGRSSRSSRHTP